MGFAGKINPEQLQEFISQGHSRADAARHFGVTRGAISQALNNPKRPYQITKSSIDMMGQIHNIIQTIYTQFTKAEKEGLPTEQARKTLGTMVKLAAELRQQVETVVRIAGAWDQHQAFERFKDNVFDALAETTCPVCGAQTELLKEAIRRIKEKGMLRRSEQIRP